LIPPVLWTAHILIAVFYAALIGSIFSSWLRPFHQPQRGGPELAIRAGDLTPLFSVWTQITARSLFHNGQWPLWSDHIYCGEPFFAKPQIGVISLTTLFCAVLPAQVVATWTFLLHLWIAGMAMYGWCLYVLNRAPLRPKTPRSVGCLRAATLTCLPAACGGIAFMLSAMLVEHTMIGHGPIVLVASWTPWMCWLVAHAFVADRPIRLAALAGGLVAAQLLAGGETIFLYNAIAGFVIAIAWISSGRDSTTAPAYAELRPGRRARWLRTIVVGAVIGVVGFGLSAVKVLPSLELMPVSNRAGGLSLQDAIGFIAEFTEPATLRVLTGGVGELGDWRHIFALTMLLATIGLIVGLRDHVLRWYALAALLLMGTGIAIAHSQTVFGILWHVLPMFRYQRIPQRALVLMYLGVSLLVAIGARRLIDTRFGPFLAWALAVLLLISLTGETWLALPPLPPSADIRQEIAENSILNAIARRPGRFRIHAVESNDRNWGIEHVTVPLGLSNLAGWDHLWLLEYLGAEGTMGRDVRPFLAASYECRHPARFWGLMNVRFVTSTRQISVPGLQLAGQFPVSRRCQPAKSAGPYLYENSEWMPRAWVVPSAILVLGDRAERLEAAYQLLDNPDFDPRRVIVIQSDRAERAIADELSQYHAVAIPARWLMDANRALDRTKASLITYRMDQSDRGRQFRWVQPADVAAVFDSLTDKHVDEVDANQSQGPADEVSYGEMHRSGRVRLEISHRPGFLVLAEKFAHFPGWIAASDAGPRTLLMANGVASAVRLDGSENWIEFSYWPSGLTYGLWITGASLLLVPLLGWLGDRMIRV
jgi:hypothetical protein